MKLGVLVAIVIISVTAIIFGSISYNTYVNRDKPHVYTPEETFANECAKRGGNPKTSTGWNGGLYIEEYKCEGVSDVHN